MALLKGLRNESFDVLVAGIFALGLGVVQVVGYNSWSLDYRGIITLFGWLSLVKGIAIIFFPGYMKAFAGKLIDGKWYTTGMAVLIIIGAYLYYMGITG